MKRILFTFGFFIALYSSACSQVNDNKIDIDDFNMKAETASWLCIYDAIAW